MSIKYKIKRSLTLSQLCRLRKEKKQELRIPLKLEIDFTPMQFKLRRNWNRRLSKKKKRKLLNIVSNLRLIIEVPLIHPMGESKDDDV